MASILVVEDEEAIRELIAMTLESQGFDVVQTGDGEAALQLATTRPELILLDWMLPGLSGLDVLQRLKQQEGLRDIPVILLTAKCEESDIVLGLEMGAADYVTKPFSNKVLVARIRTQLRKEVPAAGGEETGVLYDRLHLLPEARRAYLDGGELELTCGEFDLLYLLATHPGRVYTRGQIVALTKGDDYTVTDRAVDVQMVALRRKLGTWGETIETVRGVGYRLRDLRSRN